MQKNSKSSIIRGFILKRTESGAWQEGKRIPSEAELMDRFSVSRMTVHRVVKELAAEGRLVRERGRGTFVTKRVPRSDLLNIRDIAEEIIERGSSYFNEVKHLGVEGDTPLTNHVFGSVGIKSVARSTIVHYENGEPLQLEDRWVNLDLVSGYLDVDFTRTTPYKYLMREAPLQKAEHELTAVLPNASQQQFLKVMAGEPCLLLKRKTWSGDRLVTYAELLYPASRYTFGGTFTPAK